MRRAVGIVRPAAAASRELQQVARRRVYLRNPKLVYGRRLWRVDPARTERWPDTAPDALLEDDVAEMEVID